MRLSSFPALPKSTVALPRLSRPLLPGSRGRASTLGFQTGTVTFQHACAQTGRRHHPQDSRCLSGRSYLTGHVPATLPVRLAGDGCNPGRTPKATEPQAARHPRLESAHVGAGGRAWRLHAVSGPHRPSRRPFTRHPRGGTVSGHLYLTPVAAGSQSSTAPPDAPFQPLFRPPAPALNLCPPSLHPNRQTSAT